MKILIVPFDGIEEGILERLKKDIAALLGADTDLCKEMPLPNLSWRGQQASAHDFVLMVEEAAAMQGADYGIGITNKDIYDFYNQRLNYIFGFASGNSAVVSTARLEGDLLLNRLSKEAVHELGRCMGLDYCDNPECIMAYAGSVEDIDKKNMSFCSKCAKKLKK